MDARKRRSTSEHHERLRKVTKLTSAPLNCPVCDITLRPDTIAAHYEQELQRIQAPPPSRHRKKRVSQQSARRSQSTSEQPQSVSERAQTVLDSVRRRRFLYERPQSSDQPGPSHHTPHSTCPVCEVTLPSDVDAASSHVTSCLREGAGSSSGSDVEYEEYTWCDVTRVRATSMLSPQARANMFNGTVMSSAADTSLDVEVDIEGDDTATYGPPQFSEEHVRECTQLDPDHVTTESDHVTAEPDHVTAKESSEPAVSTLQCLICMSGYTEPLVSVLCWHVYCETCWLQALKAQKLCPKCKRITCAGDLRRIFL